LSLQLCFFVQDLTEIGARRLLTKFPDIFGDNDVYLPQVSFDEMMSNEMLSVIPDPHLLQLCDILKLLITKKKTNDEVLKPSNSNTSPKSNELKEILEIDLNRCSNVSVSIYLNNNFFISLLHRI